ncbi:metastasis suppressor protein 1-like isoform X2 [Myotis lucifugus]|uniref:metastasis suppressor protein 1-like isoform X2 n=1 Tax=Myotis lucifugus TaxID=59463 RepID=UPI000CCC2E51|nr:metastasis suppressor protein 1-like isoform X2 [Myotis lucifugus]
MEAVIEKECSALGGLFQTIISDMKGSYPVWEDFINKAGKLQSQLRTTVVAAAAFLDAFQKVADMATNTRVGQYHHPKEARGTRSSVAGTVGMAPCGWPAGSVGRTRVQG